MEPVLIPTSAPDLHRIEVRDVNTLQLDNPVHFHDACEIVLMQQSEGKRVIGDHVESYAGDELILMGPRLAHAWFNSLKGQPVQATVVYFRPDWLSNSYYESSDLKQFRRMLFDMQRGVNVRGKTRELAASRLGFLKNSDGLRRTILLLEILELIASSGEYHCLASHSYSNAFKPRDTDRITRIYNYVMDSFAERIELGAVAALAHMTTTSFCKYFKSKTGKTFSAFLNEIRISHACRLLADENNQVMDVYSSCGFNNFSNFNRTFKSLKGMSPSDFRKILRNK